MAELLTETWILINPCNGNQLDALFILSLFRQLTSTCFGHIWSPSSGGILYIYNNWYVLCFLVDCVGRQNSQYSPPTMRPYGRIVGGEYCVLLVVVGCSLRRWLAAQGPLRNAKSSQLTLPSLKLYELRFPLEPLLLKGVFMPRNICCLDVYKIQEGQAISMQTLATSWHRSLVVYIKRAVLSMIICKQHFWNQWETIKMLIRYDNSSHLGTSRAFYLILTLQKSEALWIEISAALLWHKRWI